MKFGDMIGPKSQIVSHILQQRSDFLEIGFVDIVDQIETIREGIAQHFNGFSGLEQVFEVKHTQVENESQSGDVYERELLGLIEGQVVVLVREIDVLLVVGLLRVQVVPVEVSFHFQEKHFVLQILPSLELRINDLQYLIAQGSQLF